jgi:GNAT superfamily N-acetyltransferase
MPQPNIIFRDATIPDIPQIQRVRHSVKENTLSDPALVTDKDCEVFLTIRGKGWVCEIGHQIVGFSIVDKWENNIWALFVHPAFESKGIGKKLHNLMVDWYFTQTKHAVWLGTAPNTRAEQFYAKMGWAKKGAVNKGEVKFEMTFAKWEQLRPNPK